MASPSLLCALSLTVGCFNASGELPIVETDGGTLGAESGDGTDGATTQPMMSTTGVESQTSTESSGSSSSSPSETGSETSEGESGTSTGGDPLCGNGDLDEGEACDDANEVDGDGCNVDCVESGTPLLTVTYDDPAHEADMARGVKVTPDGDFVVVGTVTHAALGQALDGWIRKYADDGSELWTDTYNNTFANDNDVFYGVDVDDSGTIAVGGYETRSDVSQAENIWVRIYDTDGNEDWTATYNTSPANNTDVGHGVGIDDDGNVYVGGYVARFDLTQDRNIRVAKYSSTGAAQWEATYDNPNHGQDRCRDFKVDAAGNGVCAGYEYRADLATGFDHLVVKTSADGNVLWTHAHDSGANGEDTLWAVAISDAGDIVGAGLETRDDLGQGRNIWIRKLDADGNELWTRTQDGPASLSDNVEAVVIDGEGNVVVAGSVSTAENDTAVWVRKFDPDGETLWTDLDDLGDGVDGVTALDVWPDGRIVAAGYIDAAANGEATNVWIRIYAP